MVYIFSFTFQDSTLSFRSSDLVTEQNNEEEKQVTSEQMNKQFQNPEFDEFHDPILDEFRTPAFGESGSVRLISPMTSNDKKTSDDKTVVSETKIAPAEHKVVHCADLSQLECLFGMLNLDSSMTDGAESHGMFGNLIDGEYLDGRECRNSKNQDGISFTSDPISQNRNNNPQIAVDFEHPELENKNETIEIRSSFEEQQNVDGNVGGNYSAMNRHVGSSKAVSEKFVTDSMQVEESFIEPVTSTVQFSEVLVTDKTGASDNRHHCGKYNDGLDLSELQFITDGLFTSTPDCQVETNIESTFSGNQEDSNGRLKIDDCGFGHGSDRTDNSSHRTDYGVNQAEHIRNPADYDVNRVNYDLRRSHSEDFAPDVTLTDSLIKSRSEVTLSPATGASSLASTRGGVGFFNQL